MAMIDDLMAQVTALVARVSTLLGKRDLSQAEFASWFGGAANGGPNGDGMFPLTDSTGFVRMVPSPAKQMADAETGGTVTAGGFEALAVATAAEIVPAATEIILRAAPGAAAKRASPYLIMPRKTVDRDVLNGSEIAEWIDCIANTGVERKIPYSDLQKQFGGVIDPTRPPYNVRYDYKKMKPISITAGSNRVTSTSAAAFTSADVGKIMCVSVGTSIGPLVGYIGQVEDSRNVRLFTALDFVTPANAQNTRSKEEAIWGTDCTAGMQAAFDAAEPPTVSVAGGTTPLGAVVVIGGIALVRFLRFGSISVVGLADTGCGFAALPQANAQSGFFADKIDGIYATLRPDGYTLKNLSFFCQKNTQYYSSFRRGLEIRGGLFGNFVRGAPYARVENIDVWEAQVDGIATSGAFAGQFNSIRAMFCNQVGMRMGFWDLNGQNWHVEGNGACGVFSVMPGASVSTVRSAFNGESGGSTGLAGGFFPHEYGSNWTEAGYGNTIMNLRMQESWAHNLCFTGTDPRNVSNGRGSKNAFFIGTFDDTGDIVPGQGRSSAVNMPGVRSMVYFKGNTTIDNTVELVTGSGQVIPTNFATNAYWDEGNPSGNQVTIRTPGTTNAVEDWYPGGVVAGRTTTPPATARGPWGTSSSSSIGSRGNVVTINGATAP